MKIEKLTENKIRIIVSLQDLNDKNVDLHSFMANSIESQSIFLEMLNRAEKEVGFVTKDCKLLIEAFAYSESEFVFTITKFSKEPKADISVKKKFAIKRKLANLNVKTSTYSFESFDEFCAFCSSLKNSNLSNIKNLAKNISLYKYKNIYYLVLTNINIDFADLNRFYASLSEFGKLVGHSNNFEGKLIEHGKIMIKRNAIQVGMKYFS